MCAEMEARSPAEITNPAGEAAPLIASLFLFHSSVSDCQSLHHVAKLFKLDLSVIVFIDFFQ